MLYVEAIKSIAECLSHLADDMNKKGQYTSDLERLTEIINEEIELPSKEKSANSDRFHYDGIDQLDKPIDERGDEYGVITFSISRGDTKILEFSTNNDCNWVMAKDDDGQWYTSAAIKINTKTKWTASYSLRKLALKEEEEPGSFAKKYIPPKPVIVRRNNV